MKIKAESLPTRCEICHQSDEFDPVLNQCERCRTLMNGHQGFSCVASEIGNSRVNRPGRIHINPGIYLLLCFFGVAIGLSEYDAWLKIGFTFKWLAEIWIWVGIVSLSFPLMVGIAKLWRDRRHKLQIISDNTSNWVSIGMIFLLIGEFILAQARISSFYWDHRKAVQVLKNIHEAQRTYQTQLGQGEYATSIWMLGGYDSRAVSPKYVEMEEKTSSEFVKDSGYQIVSWRVESSTSDKPARYELKIAPKQTGIFIKSGIDCFYLDETGKIRHSGNPEQLADKTSELIEENYTSQ